YGWHQVRSAALLVALLSTEETARLVVLGLPELQKVSAEGLRKNVPDIVSGSVEDVDSPAAYGEAAAEAPAADETGGPRALPGSKTPNLDQFTIDLTAAAKNGKVDPVLGRDFEIRQIVDILTRRRQNNPILTGEAGVGKTAVVEGFALRIASGDVPPALRDI